MAVLNKTWGSISGIAPAETTAVVTGEEQEQGAVVAPKLLEKPMMVFVTDGNAGGGFDKVEKVVLMDDKVCIGMWAFQCVKITPEDAAKDPILSETGTDVPRFVFISRDRKDVDVVDEKKMSSKNVYKVMTAQAKKAYTTKFDRNIGDVLKLLGELDKINNERRLLAEKEARETDPSAADKRKFESERAELETREKSTQEEKAKLLDFELKEIKTA